jgi:hypothetical protein
MSLAGDRLTTAVWRPNLWLCCEVWNCLVTSTRSLQGNRFPFPSPFFLLAANLILVLWAIFFFGTGSTLRRTQSNGRRLICWSRPSISLLYFLSPPRSSVLLLIYLSTHAPSNTSPLPFPRIRLDPPRAGRISTNTPWSYEGDALPSPGERKSAHSDSGHPYSADD